ncbi:MAG: ABC transporter permease, partial [Anaerolineae bacterium]|nr:ABC transporter permease [Anaerolineae bacterium]
MGVIRHKTWYDLWENKGRTFQVVLIIAIGAFAIGTTMGALEFISRDITTVWRGTTPPMIGMWVDPPIDDGMIESLEGLDGVEALEGRLEEGIKWRRSPDDAWQTADLLARPDYDDQKINTFALDRGEWPHRKTMAVEREHGLDIGDTVYLEIDEKEYQVEIGGVIYNTMVAPSTFGGGPTFYTTRDRFGQLTGESNFDRIFATLPAYDPDTALAVADDIQAHLEKQDYEVGAALPNDRRTTSPDEHFIQDDLDGVFYLLTSLSVVALVLGLFLVYNTITAIISQQVNQIGMMKAVGAGFWHILSVYFLQVMAYALLALLLAIPLGALGAQGLRIFLVSLFNMEPGRFGLLPHVLLTQTAVALLSPLLVAVVPIFVGARLTVREAISTYGLGGTAGFIDRFLIKMQNLPRSVALMISNTFRNKGRVVVIQLTLVGSGLVFMMVMNTQASLVYTFGDVLFETFKANVFLSMDDQERIESVEEIALAHPDVTNVEMWGFASGTLRPMDRPESNDDVSASIRGLPVPTETYVPQMRAGRWLEPDDTYAVVLNQELAEKVGVGVGDWVTLDIPLKRESHWLVVGLLFEVFNENAAHVPRDTLLKETHEVGRATILRVQTAQQ